MATFDDIIRSTLQQRTSQRGDPQQEARDFAARQMNMQARGVNSTAYPAPAQASVAQAAAPATGPAPVSDLQAAIAAQVGEEGPPVPQSAPRAEDAGYDTRAEAIADNRAARSPIEETIVQQMGDASVAENSQLPPAEQFAQPARPVTPTPPAQQSGINVPGIIATVAALGGTAGVAALISRYRMGDPDAARTFQAVGINPDDLSMFAGEPSSALARGAVAPERMQQSDAGLQTLVPRQDISDPRVTPALKDVYPVGAAQMAAPQDMMDADQVMENTRYNELAKQAAEGAEANERIGSNSPEYRSKIAQPKAKSAKNLPNSRPKSKVKVKAK